MIRMLWGERESKNHGIARIQGFVIFVKNGKVGDKVKVKS
jgi:predicted RNA-binding protein with TRAM domain